MKRKKPIQRRPTSNKFGVANPEDRQYNGVLYRSKLESLYAKYLDGLKEAGEIISWEYEVLHRLVVNGQLVAKHYPDFLVIGKFGREEIHECKGMVTSSWTKSWKLMKALYPDYHYRIITWPKMRRLLEK